LRIFVKALEDDAIPENVVVDYVPGWWGGYYFIGQYMSPVIPMAASGPVVDVATLQPNVTGISEAINFVTLADWNAVSDRVPRTGNFAAKWIGTIEIANAGRYSFGITSDDGSRLWINNQMVINNGGYHDALKKTASLHLAPGHHSIVADFFVAGGTPKMVVQYAGPDTGNMEILVKAMHAAHLDEDAALQPLALLQEPEWKEGFWGQYFFAPLQFGSKGPSVDVSTLTPNVEASSPAIKYRAYISSNGRSSLALRVVESNPPSAWCSSASKPVENCDECGGGGCQSPAAALENRAADDRYWNLQGKLYYYKKKKKDCDRFYYKY
jgi:hypothetical protein